MGDADRYLVISSDDHAGMRFRPSDPWQDFKQYMERKYWEELDRYAQALPGQVEARAPGAKADPMGNSVRALRSQAPAFQEGGESGLYDPALRTRELDADGVAGEVIFPQAVPFRQLPGHEALPYELRLAGIRAYNRWLAEFCSYQPERHAGVAQLPTDNVDDAVAEVKWARSAGLFGGVQLPLLSLFINDAEQFYHHPRFEPLWDICEELEMPIHSHVGSLPPDYGQLASGSALRTFESMAITAHRTFWFLLFSGALRRHPNLKLVFTESGGTWAPPTVDLMDELSENRNPELMHDVLGDMKPSEYWARQCYVGASPPSGRREIEQRDRIGVTKIMWGSDYPHPEGTWPYTQERLTAMFAGVPDDEVRLMLGENAARVYGFDHAKLTAIADEIGPPVGLLDQAETISAVEYARLWRYRSKAAPV